MDVLTSSLHFVDCEISVRDIPSPIFSNPSFNGKENTMNDQQPTDRYDLTLGEEGFAELLRRVVDITLRPEQFSNLLIHPGGTAFGGTVILNFGPEYGGARLDVTGVCYVPGERSLVEPEEPDEEE